MSSARKRAASQKSSNETEFLRRVALEYAHRADQLYGALEKIVDAESSEQMQCIAKDAITIAHKGPNDQSHRDAQGSLRGSGGLTGSTPATKGERTLI